MKFIDGKELSTTVKKMKSEYASIQIDEKRLTIPWIAGFADAEGCAYWENGPRLQLTQKGCPRLVEILKNKMSGYLSKNKYSVLLYSRTAIEWMLKLRPYLILKADQVDLIVQNHKNVASLPRGSKDERKRLETILKSKLSPLKHGSVEWKKKRKLPSSSDDQPPTKQRKVDK